MGKKKNKRFNKKQPTAHAFWANISNLKPVPNSAEFQAPHHQQDSMMDLTDDTSPNNPMNNAKGIPGSSKQELENQKINIATQPIFETTEEPQGDANFYEDVDVTEFSSSSNRSTSHVNWQLNKTDDESNKGVVKGAASNIKLMVQGSKTVTVAAPSPVTVSSEKPKPTILAAQTVTPKYNRPVSGPNLTIKGVPQTATIQEKKVEDTQKGRLNVLAGPNLTIKGVPQTATVQEKKVEDTQKGRLNVLDTTQINTIVNRTVNQNQPQQYIVPNVQQPAMQSNTVTQNPKQQFMSSNNQRPTIGFLNSYPKGIPKSFLVCQTEQTPEPYSNSSMNMPNSNMPKWDQSQRMHQHPVQPPNVIEYAYNYNPSSNQGYNNQSPIYVHTEETVGEKQVYSPSDVYADNVLGTGEIDADEEENTDGSESPDLSESGQKRLSAFKRLGPLTKPKKPKLTINLLCNKDQSVREVVDESEDEIEEKYVPVHLRADITTSTDDTVMKYLVFWPWKRPVPTRKTVTFRNSKSVMILEHEQMIEFYNKNDVFAQVSVTGYPPTWKKEKLMDILLDTMNGKLFIPCFIEFTPDECKFLVIRSRQSLSVFHKIGFVIHADGRDLHIAISQTDLKLYQIDFVPRTILKRRLSLVYSGERSLDLSEFTIKEDVSHFIYFPLDRVANQRELVQQPSSIAWEILTDLNLSHNRLSSIDGFNLPVRTPQLKFLDLSYNRIEKATILIRCRSLSLRTLKLEGNPLCHNYTDPSQYIKVLKLMFPTLVKIDGIPIKLQGEMPTFYKNYCPEEAKDIVEKFLEVYFPLLDSVDDSRELIKEMYHEKATMTITTKYKLRYGPIFKSFRSLFYRARVIDEGSMDSIDGAKDITKAISKWPPLKHDPFTFTIDVLMHDDNATIFKVGGLVRLTAETLAEDEHLLVFARTFVLHSLDGVEYKITNDMVYWDEPTGEYAQTAFQVTAVKPKRLSLKLESTPDEDLKKKLIEIFMELTDSNETICQKCLELKDWNLKSALEYFMKLVKLDDLETLTKEINV